MGVCLHSGVYCPKSVTYCPASIVSYHRSVKQTIRLYGYACRCRHITENRNDDRFEHLPRISPSPMVHSPWSQRAVQSITFLAVYTKKHVDLIFQSQPLTGTIAQRNKADKRECSVADEAKTVDRRGFTTHASTKARRPFDSASNKSKKRAGTDDDRRN